MKDPEKTNKTPSISLHPTDTHIRQERLQKALRQNLRRRKAVSAEKISLQIAGEQ